MLWGDGDLIKDPTGSTYPVSKQITTTVADQLSDERSLYSYYCRLLTIRHKYPAIARGEYTSLNCSDKNLGGFIVNYEGEKIAIIHNTSTEEKVVDLSQYTDFEGYTLCDFIGVGEAVAIKESTLTIGAQTSVIIKEK